MDSASRPLGPRDPKERGKARARPGGDGIFMDLLLESCASTLGCSYPCRGVTQLHEPPIDQYDHPSFTTWPLYGSN